MLILVRRRRNEYLHPLVIIWTGYIVTLVTPWLFWKGATASLCRTWTIIVHELQVSQDEVQQLGQLLSAKDLTIKDLRASRKLIAQELETAQLAVKASEDNCDVLKAQRDKAMDKAIRAVRILMRRPDVVVPDDIVADVKATPDASSHPSS
jgi:hypothetical protein